MAPIPQSSYWDTVRSAVSEWTAGGGPSVSAVAPSVSAYAPSGASESGVLSSMWTAMKSCGQSVYSMSKSYGGSVWSASRNFCSENPGTTGLALTAVGLGGCYLYNRWGRGGKEVSGKEGDTETEKEKGVTTDTENVKGKGTETEKRFKGSEGTDLQSETVQSEPEPPKSTKIRKRVCFAESAGSDADDADDADDESKVSGVGPSRRSSSAHPSSRQPQSQAASSGRSGDTWADKTPQRVDPRR